MNSYKAVHTSTLYNILNDITVTKLKLIESESEEIKGGILPMGCAYVP